MSPRTRADRHRGFLPLSKSTTATLHNTMDDVGKALVPNDYVDKGHISEISAWEDLGTELALARRQPHYILPMDGFR